MIPGYSLFWELLSLEIRLNPMRLEFFPYPFLIGLTVLLIFVNLPRKQPRDPARKFFLVVLGVYLLFLIGVTLFPIPLTSSVGGMYPRQPVSTIFERINLNPIRLSSLIAQFPNRMSFDLVGNVLLTIPFGFVLPFVARIKGIWYTGVGFGTGLGIETSQLVLSLALGVAYRAVDINDVLMNASGVMIGYAAFRISGVLYGAVRKFLISDF